MTNEEIVSHICRQVGVAFIGEGVCDLAVVGTGTGIVLSVVDHLTRPGLSIWLADLPGDIGIKNRCVAIDYIATCFPTLLVMWNGMFDGSLYPLGLRERNFKPRGLRVYTMGLNNELAKKGWLELGGVLLSSPWPDDPGGSFLPNRHRPLAVFERSGR